MYSIFDRCFHPKLLESTTVTPTRVENQPTLQPEPGWLLSRDWMITSELE